MLIRKSLNVAVHFVAGIAFGALVIAALQGQRRRGADEDEDTGLGPVPETGPPPRQPSA